MSGGEYITIFPDNEDREIRSFLYKLESLGIVRFIREKVEKNLYEHHWVLTERGKILVEKDENLKELLENKKIQEFYDSIKNLLESV